MTPGFFQKRQFNTTYVFSWPLSPQNSPKLSKASFATWKLTFPSSSRQVFQYFFGRIQMYAFFFFTFIIFFSHFLLWPVSHLCSCWKSFNQNIEESVNVNREGKVGKGKFFFDFAMEEKFVLGFLCGPINLIVLISACFVGLFTTLSVDYEKHLLAWKV